MKMSDFLKMFEDSILGAEFAEVSAAVLLVALTVLWREWRAERKRCAMLTAEMIAQNREVVILIERITGR